MSTSHVSGVYESRELHATSAYLGDISNGDCDGRDLWQRVRGTDELLDRKQTRLDVAHHDQDTPLEIHQLIRAWRCLIVELRWLDLMDRWEVSQQLHGTTHTHRHA